MESIKQQDSILSSFPDTSIRKEDTCIICSQAVDEGCLKYDDTKWHEQCLKCSYCNESLYSSNSKAFIKDGVTFCSTHKPSDSNEIEHISQLRQFGLKLTHRYVSVLFMGWSRLCELLEISENGIFHFLNNQNLVR